LSGPKIDHVELERQRRAEIERQRQIRLHQIKEETYKLNIEITKIQKQIDIIINRLTEINQSIKNIDKISPTIQRSIELYQTYKNKLIKALENSVPTEPEDISRFTHKIMNETSLIITEYNKQIEDHKNFIELSKVFSTEKEEMKEIEDFDFSFKMGKVNNSNGEPSIKDRATQILSEIEEFVNFESIQASDMSDLLAIAANIYKTAFETKNSFEAAAIEYKTIKSSIIKNIAIFDDIYQDYYSEYIAYLELINKNRALPIKIVPKWKYCFDSIKDIQDEMNLLSQKSKFVAENQYIREQINDVMNVFGYNMSSEIILDKNQNGNHYICEKNSGNSAIHIHISEKKQIMMEIVGVGKGKSSTTTETVTGIKIPSSDLKEHEREELLEEQGSFCQLHPRIVEELKKRGVILQMKKRNAPDIKYCEKIIQFSDTANINTDDLINTMQYNENATKRSRKKQELKQQAIKVNR